MKIQAATRWGRGVVQLDNGAATLTVMLGGGHIADLRLHGGSAVNPYWVPVWKSREPWEYRPAMASFYGQKLLAAIFGHNLCLGNFGEPSPEEQKAGLGSHGEAPVSRWRVQRRSVTGGLLKFAYGCEMPIAGMRIVRKIISRQNSSIFYVKEAVTNLTRRDLPFTICEHVTFGPPFLEREVTLFDMPATKGHTFPGVFGQPQRLRMNASFEWPAGPGERGVVDLRKMQKGRNSDFSAQLIDPRRDLGWFSAVNPRLGLLVAYAWKRSDFPWVGNWEENFARASAPWKRRSLTRGMEFANGAFPESVRDAVNRGRLFGVPTYAWLPARETVKMGYAIIARTVPAACKGVADIRHCGKGYAIDLKV